LGVAGACFEGLCAVNVLTALKGALMLSKLAFFLLIGSSLLAAAFPYLLAANQNS